MHVGISSSCNIKMYIRTKQAYTSFAWSAQISRTNWSKLEAIQNIPLITTGITSLQAFPGTSETQRQEIVI